MLDNVKVLNINRSIQEFAGERLSQKEARNRMLLKHGILDSFQLRIWIAVGYYMYEKKKKGERLNEKRTMG